MSNKLKAAALSLAQRGMAVFPIAPRGKTPLTTHGFRDARKDPEQINAWWERWRDANIGVATGAASGVLVVDVDIDEAKGENGEATLRDIQNKMQQPLPATVEAITGGGGRHLFFKLPHFDGAPVIRSNAKQVGPGLDIRAEGGYVVVPPSIHESGRPYAWSVDSATEFAELPVWFVWEIRKHDGVTNLDERRPAEHWPRIAHNGAQEGSRNHTTASLTGYLLRRGLDAHTTCDLVLGWNALRNQPPLPETEVLHVVQSIVERELRRLRGL
jgi:hypothetical protein